MRTFVIASNNLKKVRELNRILIPLGIMAKTPKEMNITLDDVEETGTTFIENARLKARAAYELTGLPCIADDSGLMVDALNGAPGVYSARYSDEGTDECNNKKLLSKLNDVEDDKRTARFVCSVCCYFSEDNYFFVNGKCEGKIAREGHGDGGFGYDPLFLSDDLGVTFAQAEPEAKNGVSHRARAIKKLIEALEAEA